MGHSNFLHVKQSLLHLKLIAFSLVADGPWQCVESTCSAFIFSSLSYGARLRHLGVLYVVHSFAWGVCKKVLDKRQSSYCGNHDRKNGALFLSLPSVGRVRMKESVDICALQNTWKVHIQKSQSLVCNYCYFIHVDSCMYVHICIYVNTYLGCICAHSHTSVSMDMHSFYNTVGMNSVSFVALPLNIICP